jgi:hypothetical protein
VSRARNRPPRIEMRVAESQPAPPATLAELIVRSRVAGTGSSGPGPTELRRKVERLATGDRRALGEVAQFAGLTVTDAWSAITAAFGATAEDAAIVADCTVRATGAAVSRIREVAATGGRVAIASARPASLLTVHLALARLVRAAGGELIDLADFGPIRADGRTPRWLRWMGGVAVVSDGNSLCATSDGEAAREWLFALPRPALVVADGPFAEVAWEGGMEVVALAGLDRPALAVAAARGGRCTVVPMHTDRPALAYRVIEELIAARGADPEAGTELDLVGPPPVFGSEL